MASGDGQRRREEHELEFSRIVAFSDGVFAIAITLLVLQLDLPQHVTSNSELAHGLRAEDGDLLAYAISFAVIGRFWLVHHRFFGEIVRFDSRLMTLNLTYLAVLVLIPYSSDVLGEYGDKEAAVVLYSVNLALLTLVSAAMTDHAIRAGLTREGRSADLRAGRNGALYAAAIFALSIPFAFLVPEWAPLVWLLIVFDPTGHRRRAKEPDAAA